MEEKLDRPTRNKDLNTTNQRPNIHKTLNMTGGLLCVRGVTVGAREDIRHPEAGIPGSCELATVGAGTKLWSSATVASTFNH